MLDSLAEAADSPARSRSPAPPWSSPSGCGPGAGAISQPLAARAPPAAAGARPAGAQRARNRRAATGPARARARGARRPRSPGQRRPRRAANRARRGRDPGARVGRPLASRGGARRTAARARLGRRGARLACDPGAVSRALDNLIANALEHGCGPVRVEGSERGGRLRIVVADGADAGGAAPPATALSAARAAPPRRPGPRRGHGLGSSPTSPPRTEGGSRPAHTPPGRAPCSSCRSRRRPPPGGEPPCAGGRLRRRGGALRRARGRGHRRRAHRGRPRRAAPGRRATATLPARRPIRRGALDRLLELRRLPERFLRARRAHRAVAGARSPARGADPRRRLPGRLAVRAAGAGARAPAPQLAGGRRPVEITVQGAGALARSRGRPGARVDPRADRRGVSSSAASCSPCSRAGWAWSGP